MLSALDTCNKFILKHRGKLVITAALAIGVAVYYNYNNYNSNNNKDNDYINEELIDEDLINPNIIYKEKNNRNKLTKDKIKMLLLARKQFDLSCKQFLLTLKLQIIEVVDISSVVRQIKELRKSSQSITESNNKELEYKLWEDIKIGSFTQLFVTIYMVSILCTLLRVQMHLLAQSFNSIQPNTTESKKFDEDEDIDDSSLFLSIVEDTYKHMFGSGLRTLSSIIRQRVSVDFIDWNVNDKVAVEYGELVHIISKTRRHLESDIYNMIKVVIIPPDATVRKLTDDNITPTSASIIDKELVKPIDSSGDLNQIVYKVWEISESPMFAAALNEVIDSCYNKIFEQFRQTIYINTNITNTNQLNYPMNIPALASLLPQVKATSLTLLPNEAKSINIKDILSGPILDSLCMSTFQK